MLRIAKLTDYAIVVLAHMARNAHRCVHPATDLAEQTVVPLPTVQKVLKVLLREGLVVSMRGARGPSARAVARCSSLGAMRAIIPGASGARSATTAIGSRYARPCIS